MSKLNKLSRNLLVLLICSLFLIIGLQMITKPADAGPCFATFFNIFLGGSDACICSVGNTSCGAPSNCCGFNLCFGDTPMCPR